MSGDADTRAWLELMRASNLPTVWTNVLAAGALVAASGAPLEWVPIIGAAASLSLMYLGGMVLNDVCDARTDAAERPGRPIPSGRIPPADATRVAWACLLLGVIAAVMLRPEAGLLALLLLAVIVAYNVLHERFAGAVVLMGLCRGLVYAVTAMAVLGRVPPAVQWVAAAVGAYTVLLSLVARGETSRPTETQRRFAWLTLTVVPAIWLGLPEGHTLSALLVGLVAILRLARCARLVTRGRTVPGVLGLLAAFCLLDAFALMLAGRPLLAAAAAVLFFLTTLAHRPVPGT